MSRDPHYEYEAIPPAWRGQVNSLECPQKGIVSMFTPWPSIRTYDLAQLYMKGPNMVVFSVDVERPCTWPGSAGDDCVQPLCDLGR